MNKTIKLLVDPPPSLHRNCEKKKQQQHSVPPTEKRTQRETDLVGFDERQEISLKEMSINVLNFSVLFLFRSSLVY